MEWKNTTIADAVTTLIYASVLNAIIDRALDLKGEKLIFALGIIIFIFIDWLSRIGIPI